MNRLLEVNNLEVYHGWVQALHGVSLQVSEGELVAVLGPNGAGKSTLMGALAGLHRPAGGEIILKGSHVTAKPAEYMVRQGISLVPERREIFSSLSVLDNLLLGAYHRYHIGKSDIRQDAERILELFPALKGRENQPAGMLSGGLQQMLAIGRGLMARPSFLLLDEPSTGLAPLVVKEIMATLASLKETGVAVVLVEQNTAAALKVADRALVMERGRVVLSGGARDMLGNTRVQDAYLGRARPVSILN